MAKERLPLFKRDPKNKPPFKLQERDIEIIKLVYDHRFLDSEQISLLIQSNHRATLRRLQGLYHHHFLDRPREQITYYIFNKRKIIYALDNKGADILTERYGIDRQKIDWHKKNQEVKERYLNHCMMISNFRTCLTLALRKTKETKLVNWLSGQTNELREKIIFEDKTLIFNPDAFFTIRDKEDLLDFALEADQSTMTNQRFIKKLLAYWQTLKEKKRPPFRVLIITKSEARAENLRIATKKAFLAQETPLLMFWFTCEKNYNLKQPESILKAIWKLPKDDNSCFSLLEF